MSDRIVTDEEIQQMLAISGYIEGAWFVSRDVVCAPGNDNDLWMVAEICGSCGHPQDTSDANATLIAAAPDLQAALRQTLVRALAAEAEVERLRADNHQGAQDYCDLMEQRDRQHVLIEKLKNALRPFVEYVHDDLRRGKATYELVAVDRHGGGLIGAEDLRRARVALKETGHDR